MSAHSGSVEVSSTFEGENRLSQVIEAAQFKGVPIGVYKAGDSLALRITATNKVYNDITACVVSEEEARVYSAGSICRGKQRSRTPFVIQGKIPTDSRYYLILDNSYANLIKKNIVVEMKYQRILSEQDTIKIKRPLQDVLTLLKNTFENADFNINVKPCGQSNAFSDHQTADITLCSEIINELSSQGNQGVLLATLLHEYGHSLLNKWGEPGSSEEDMADQFATVMLLRGGDKGRALLQQWTQYWVNKDSIAEANYQLSHGDSHSLSIQRARNIQQSIAYPEEITRRWNKMLYRHMSRATLENIINRPTHSDDLDLARDALASK